MGEENEWDRLALGALLRGRRREKGFTLRDVGDRVALSHGHVAKLERGELQRPPDFGMLARVCDVLGLQLEEALTVGHLSLKTRPTAIPRDGGEQFATLMLAPDYKPRDMQRAFLAHFPPLHRRLIVELAVNAFQRGEAFGRTGEGEPIEALLGMFRADLEADPVLVAASERSA